jgi:hypothetical protein
MSQEKNTKVQRLRAAKSAFTVDRRKILFSTSAMLDQSTRLHPRVFPNCVRYELGTLLQQSGFPLDGARLEICTWKCLE